MGLSIGMVTLDCSDPQSLARFWTAALDTTVAGDYGASAPAQEFSAQRAPNRLQDFATEPRPLGSTASDRTRDYLVGALRSAGFSVQINRAVGGTTAEGGATFGRVDSIVAAQRGRDPTGSVVLAAGSASTNSTTPSPSSMSSGGRRRGSGTRRSSAR